MKKNDEVSYFVCQECQKTSPCIFRIEYESMSANSEIRAPDRCPYVNSHEANWIRIDDEEEYKDKTVWFNGG